MTSSGATVKIEKICKSPAHPVSYGNLTEKGMDGVSRTVFSFRERGPAAVSSFRCRYSLNFPPEPPG